VFIDFLWSFNGKNEGKNDDEPPEIWGCPVVLDKPTVLMGKEAVRAGDRHRGSSSRQCTSWRGE